MKAKGRARGSVGREEARQKGGGEETAGSPEGRAVLRASNPSCKPRGINGRQLARLSTVFLALPAEAQQSVCAGRGASAAQRARPGSRAAEPEREGAASTLVSGIQAARRSRERPPGPARRRAGGEEVGAGRREVCPGRRPGVLPAPKVNLLLFCSVPRQILGGFPQLHGHSPYGLPGRGERYVG